MGDQVTDYLVKRLEQVKKKLISHLELLQQAQFINCYIYMTCRLKKLRKPLQGSFVEILLYQPRGKALAVSQ